MMTTVEDLAKTSPFGDGRVEMGFGMDEFPYSGEKTAEIFKKVKSWGIKITTSHYIRNPAQGMHISPYRAIVLYSILTKT